MEFKEHIPHWLIADSSSLNSYVGKTIKMETSPVSKFLFFCVILSLIIPVFLFCNFRIIVYKTYLQKKSSSDNCQDLLIGNYHETDEFYARNILEESNINFSKMNQFNPHNYLDSNITFFSYQSLIFESCMDLMDISKIAGSDLKLNILLKAIKNILFYVIYRNFFRHQKQVGLKRVHLIAMPLLLIAALKKEHLSCSVYMHGLTIKIPKQYFPTIDKLFVLSEDEKNYYSTLMPKNNIQLYKLKSPAKYKNNAVLLLRQNLNFSNDNEDFMSIVDVQALSSFLKEINIDLYYKIHPKTDENKLHQLKETLKINDAYLMKDRTPISNNIEIIQPKFIFGWFSSGLAESLSLNILPVMMDPIKTSKKLKHFSNFNYKNRCLNFKTDQLLLKNCSEHDDKYKKILHKLKNSV